MGVDYVARKSAKKRKKRERQAVGKDGIAAQRERRRKKVRRLCQGVCYKAPELTEEDKHWSDQDDDEAVAPDSDVEEAVARANSHRGASTSSGAVPAKNPTSSKLDGRKDKDNKPQKNKRKRNSGDGDGTDDGNGDDKRPTLSTAVKLLDPMVLARNARQAALRKLPPGAKADSLERFPALLQAVMLALHHVEPTPVQEGCWPPALQGRDVQGVAEPGSGKTLAYLLPGLVKLQAGGHTVLSQPGGPAMLVLLPTRELAQQVAAQCRATRAVTGLRSVCVFGGAPREEQAALLSSKHPHVLVATPGRVLDLVDGGELKLQGHVRYLVLDEADKMLSLGFKPQLERLYGMLLKPHDDAAAAASAKAMKKAAKGKGAKAAAAAVDGDAAATTVAADVTSRPQVLLFSATMPPDVTAAAAQWLRRPEVVQVSACGANAISRTVTQVVHVCAEHKKLDKLLKHLAQIRKSVPAGCRNPPRLLVFANRVKTVRFLASSLSKDGHKVAQLHGQRSQAERNQAVSDFRSGKAQVLVATDVAARGLDIRALPYVVNYDFPSRLETYVHRVGRTGRLAAFGHAYSFFTRNLAPLAPPLLELLQAHGQAVDPNLAALAAAWKVAEEKLGSKGAAAVAAAARASDGAAGAAADGGDADGEDDDEGDGADDDTAAGVSGEQLSLAEEVLLAADDLMEGLGLQGARAIAAVVKKKLVRQQQQHGAKDGGREGDAPPAGKKRRRQVTDGVAAGHAAAMAGRDAGGAGDAQLLVPMSKEQRKVMQRQEESGGEGRCATFEPAKAFRGAMAGYAFKNGPLGLGYYLDTFQAGPKTKAAAAVPGRKAAGAVIGGKKGGTAAPTASAAAAKGQGAAVAAPPGKGAKPAGAKAASKTAAAAWGLPTRNKPIIPVRHSDFLSDSDDGNDGSDSHGRRAAASGSDSDYDRGLDLEEPADGAAAAAYGRGGNAAAGRDLHGTKKLQSPATAAAAVAPAGRGCSVDDDDDDGDAGGGGGGERAAAKRRFKSLPGRLRKKLQGRGQGAQTGRSKGQAVSRP